MIFLKRCLCFLCCVINVAAESGAVDEDDFERSFDDCATILVRAWYPILSMSDVIFHRHLPCLM